MSLSLSAAGFPLSANEDLGLDLTVYLEDIRRIVAIVECTGDEEKLSECVISKTIGLSEDCAVSAVSCIGEWQLWMCIQHEDTMLC